MSFSSFLLTGWAKRHLKKVEASYPQRNLRPLNFSDGAIYVANRADPEGKIFNNAFFDDLRDQANTTHETLIRNLGIFILVSIAILAIKFGTDVTIIHGSIRLGEIGKLMDFVLVFSSFCVYTTVTSFCKEYHLQSLIHAYVKNSDVCKKKAWYREGVEALWLTKYGYSHLYYSQNRILIKGKYIVKPRVIRKLIDHVFGISLDFFIIAAMVLYGYISLKLIFEPPVNIYVSVVSVSLFWIIVALSFLEFFSLFFSETGILAKGRKQLDAGSPEQNLDGAKVTDDSEG